MHRVASDNLSSYRLLVLKVARGDPAVVKYEARSIFRSSYKLRNGWFNKICADDLSEAFFCIHAETNEQNSSVNWSDGAEGGGCSTTASRSS